MPSRKVPVTLQPGINLNMTEYQAQGRYVSCDHVRFVDGMPEKIGGWVQWNEDGDELTPVCRSSTCWQDFNFNTWYAFGTSSRLWVFDQDRTRTNITPFESTGTIANPFSTTNGSATVNVGHVAHGVAVDQYVNYSGASAVGGITVDGEYQVTAVIDADNFEIVHSTAATSTAGPGGGASVAFSYEIEAGNVSIAMGGGWGLGTWGTGTWGTPRASVTFTQLPRMWSLDRYGQYLLALPSNGTLYQWQIDTADRAEAVTNAPDTALFMFVTSERMVVCLGTNGNFMEMRWSDDDDITVWAPGPSNSANIRTLQEGSRLVAGARMGQQVNILWTDTAIYLMQYIGSNFVYSTRNVGLQCGLIGPGAFAVVDGVAYWMSARTFMMYNGSLQEMPRASEIQPIFDSLDEEQRFKVACYFNPDFREIWWHYPSTGQTEPDRYVMVSLDDWSWVTGSLQRNAYGIMTLVGKNTILAVDENGTIFEHESGVDADGEALAWHIESAFFDIENGNKGLNIDGYIPDYKRQTGDFTLTFTSLDMPEDTDTLDSEVETVGEGDSMVDLRHFGRQAKFRLEQDEVGGDFRLGLHRIEISDRATKRQR